MMKFAETHLKGTWNETSVIKSIYAELEMVFQIKVNLARNLKHHNQCLTVQADGTL